MARQFLTPITLPAAATGYASMRLPHGTAPSSPVNGDLWTTTAGLFARVNSGTVGPYGVGTVITSGSPASGQAAFFSAAATTTNAAGVVTGATATVASLAGAAQFAIGAGTFTTSVSASALSVTTATTATLTSVVRQQAISASVTTSSGTTASGNIVAGVTSIVAGTPTTGFAGEYVGVYAYSSRLTDGASAVSTATYTSVKATTAFDTTLAAGTAATSLYGVRSSVQVAHTAASGTSLVTNLFGLASEPTITVTNAPATFTITNYYGLYLATHTFSGAGTLTLTNRYGVYQADTLAQNFFAGYSGLGVAATTGTALNLPASIAARSSLRVAHGTAPTTNLSNGDIWTTTAGLFARINGATVGPFAAATAPGGATTQVQYNNAGAFGGSAQFVWVNADQYLVVTNTQQSGGGAIYAYSDLSAAASAAGNSEALIGSQTLTVDDVWASGSMTGMSALAYASCASAGSTSTLDDLIGARAASELSTQYTVGGTVTLTNQVGLSAEARADVATAGTVNVTSVSGLRTSNLLSAGTAVATLAITNLYGLNITSDTPSVTGAGALTVGTVYGVYIGTLATGITAGTARYGVYQADTGATNYFAGLVKTVESVEVGAAKWVYMGDPVTDGTWRMGRSGNNLIMERRESGSYVTKQTIVP